MKVFVLLRNTLAVRSALFTTRLFKHNTHNDCLPPPIILQRNQPVSQSIYWTSLRNDNYYFPYVQRLSQDLKFLDKTVIFIVDTMSKIHWTS